MTAFEKDVIERLSAMNQKISEIQEALGKDYKVLHGNGSPGLIHRVTVIEHNLKWVKWIIGGISAGLGVFATNLKEWIK